MSEQAPGVGPEGASAAEDAGSGPETPQLPPAGWYPDPQNPVNHRWWDGTAWTDAVHSVLRNDARYQAGTSAQETARLGQDVRASLRDIADVIETP